MSANFRLLERFRRRHRPDPPQMKLFDSEFEKLLKEDPNLEKRKQKKKNSSDEEDVVLGRLPRKPISTSSCSSQSTSRRQLNISQNEISSIDIPSNKYKNTEIMSSRSSQELTKLQLSEYSVSVGTEVRNSINKSSNNYSSSEVQTDSIQLSLDNLNSTNRPSASRSFSALSSVSSFDNGGVVLEVNDTSEVDFLKSLGQDFIMLDHEPSDNEMNSLQQLPKTVGLYLPATNLLLTYLLPNSKNSVYYNAQIKQSYPLERNLQYITNDSLKHILSNFETLTKETRSINNTKYGTLLTEKHQINDIIRNNSIILIFDPLFTFKNYQIFQNLPNNLAYFVISDRELAQQIFPNIDFSTNMYYYRFEDRKTLKMENIDSPESLNRFLETNSVENPNETRTLLDFKFGSVLKTKDNLVALINSGNSFLLFDHIPNPEEKEILNNLKHYPYFICLDPIILDTLRIPQTKNGIFKYSNTMIEEVNDLQKISEKDLKVDERCVGSLNYGIEVNSEDQVKELLESNKNVIFLCDDTIDTSIFDNLPENTCYFRIKDKNVIDRFCPGFDTETGVVYYRSIDGRCFDLENSMTEEDLFECLEEVKISYENDDERDQNGIKYGSVIRDLPILDDLAEKNEFFVFNRVPTENELKILKNMSSNYGYFIVTAPKLLQKFNLDNDDEKIYFSSKNGLSREINFPMTQENLDSFINLMNLMKIYPNILNKQLFDKIIQSRQDVFIEGSGTSQLKALDLAETFLILNNQEISEKSVYFIPTNRKFVAQYHDKVNLSAINKFLLSKLGSINGIKFGTKINLEQINELKKNQFSFFLVNENCNISRIPQMIGYFVVNDELLKNQYPGLENCSSLYYCAKNQRVFPYNRIFAESELNEFFLNVYSQNTEPELTEIADERQICSINYGKILNEKQIMELNENSFFLFSKNPSERVVEIFKDLPYDVGYFLIKDISLINKIDEIFSEFPDNNIIFYNGKTKTTHRFDFALTELSFWSFLDSQLFGDFYNTLSNMSMSLRHVYNGSLIARPSQVKLILAFDFFLMNRRLTDEEKEILQVLPDNIHYFISPSVNVMKFIFNDFYSPKSMIFFDHNNNSIIEYNLPLTKEDLLNFLYENKILTPPPQIPKEEHKINPRFAHRIGSSLSNSPQIVEENNENLFDEDESENDQEDDITQDEIDKNTINLTQNQDENINQNENEELSQDTETKTIINDENQDDNENIDQNQDQNENLNNEEQNEENQDDNEEIEDQMENNEEEQVNEIDSDEELKDLIEKQNIGRNSTFRLSLRDLANQANEIFEKDEIQLETIEEDIVNHMLDSSDLEDMMSDDFEDEDENQNEDPFSKFENVEEKTEEKEEIAKPSSRKKSRKSRIPVKQKKSNDLYEFEENQDLDDKELNEAIEDEIFGQTEVPDDVPRDIFGFPTTKPQKIKKINEKFTDLKSLWLIIKRRYIAISKKGHSFFPWTRDRAEAISNLIERQRSLHELAYINRRIRALTRANLQLRLMPDVGYTRIIRNREGRRLELSLAAANKRIEILRNATSLDENGRSKYEIENELEKFRVKMLVNLSKRKKTVTDMQSEISDLQHTLAELDKRINLMTQGKSIYTKFFSKKPKLPDGLSESSAPRIKRH